MTHNVDLLRRWRNQLGTNACVGHAACTLGELARSADGLPDVMLSAQHAYTNARLYLGAVLADDGSRWRDCLRGMRAVGVAPESTWPLDYTRINQRATVEAEAAGIGFRGYEYRRLTGRGEQLREAILDALTERPGVGAGKLVYESYGEHRGTGVLPAPRPGERVIGAHATVYLDYRADGSELLEVNSWDDWGYDVTSPYGTRVQSIAWVSSDHILDPGFGDAWALLPMPQPSTTVRP